jgi:argininosuccinate lyase
MALWGGRFEGTADPLFRQFNDSLRFDYRLARHDILGSIAWAKALGRAKVLTDQEVTSLTAALKDLDAAVEKDPALPLQSKEEDIHSWVESELIKRLGPLGKKLHTGRSRNDQVATDLRLFVLQECHSRANEIVALQQALVNLAEREQQTLLPGYTHLQRAQPVLFPHWALAYFEMLARDNVRFSDAAITAMNSPLGSAALAGTTYAVDRHKISDDLAFLQPTLNSLDAVSDRDFVVETLAAASLCAVHLSRLAEDLILYTTQEFAFVEMDDAVTSGSSLMPQKKNPDAMELIRGKTGRIIGAHVSLLTTLKGLPLAYNKDLQEDKEPLFDAMDNLSMCLQMATRVIETLKVNREATRKAAAGGYSNATELADYLVTKGIPFREAHDTVGKIVRHALSKNVPLEDLPLSDLKQFSPKIEQDVYPNLTLEACLNRRNILGGTGPQAVQQAIQDARARLSPPTSTP